MEQGTVHLASFAICDVLAFGVPFPWTTRVSTPPLRNDNDELRGYCSSRGPKGVNKGELMAPTGKLEGPDRTTSVLAGWL